LITAGLHRARETRNAVAHRDADLRVIEIAVRVEARLDRLDDLVVTLLDAILLRLRDDLEIVHHALHAPDLPDLGLRRLLYIRRCDHAEQCHDAVARVDVDVEARRLAARDQAHLRRRRDPPVAGRGLLVDRRIEGAVTPQLGVGQRVGALDLARDAPDSRNGSRVGDRSIGVAQGPGL